MRPIRVLVFVLGSAAGFGAVGSVARADVLLGLETFLYDHDAAATGIQLSSDADPEPEGGPRFDSLYQLSGFASETESFIALMVVARLQHDGRNGGQVAVDIRVWRDPVFGPRRLLHRTRV